MNNIQWLTLLVKMLEGEKVINGDFHFIRGEAIKELQALRFSPVRLVGRMSSVDVSETTLHIIAMLGDTKLNPASLEAILAYIRHDPEMLASLEIPEEKREVAECQAVIDTPEVTPEVAKKKPGRKKLSPSN